MSTTNSSSVGLGDLLEVHGRLFNHKPFLQGEIRHFVREFEEKRGDREVENIFSVLEVVTELRDIGLPGLINTSKETGLGTSLIANLQVSESMLERILEQGDTSEVEQTLASSREARDREWTLFQQESQVRLVKSEQAAREQEEGLRRKYRDLESRLETGK